MNHRDSACPRSHSYVGDVLCSCGNPMRESTLAAMWTRSAADLLRTWRPYPYVAATLLRYRLLLRYRAVRARPRASHATSPYVRASYRIPHAWHVPNGTAGYPPQRWSAIRFPEPHDTAAHKRFQPFRTPGQRHEPGFGQSLLRLSEVLLEASTGALRRAPFFGGACAEAVAMVPFDTSAPKLSKTTLLAHH